jgi:hypothetical protein
MMALPGLVALGALMRVGQNIALWPLTTFVFGLLSLWLAHIAGQAIGDLGELEEYRRLRINVTNIKWQAGLYGGYLSIFGAIGLSTVSAFAFGMIEGWLVASLLLGIANIGLLLRARLIWQCQIRWVLSAAASGPSSDCG